MLATRVISKRYSKLVQYNFIVLLSAILNARGLRMLPVILTVLSSDSS